MTISRRGVPLNDHFSADQHLETPPSRAKSQAKFSYRDLVHHEELYYVIALYGKGDQIIVRPDYSTEHALQIAPLHHVGYPAEAHRLRRPVPSPGGGGLIKPSRSKYEILRRYAPQDDIRDSCYERRTSFPCDSAAWMTLRLAVNT